MGGHVPDLNRSVTPRQVAPAHLVAAVGLTWPTVLHLPSALPAGIEPVATVPWFNLWTLRWNQDRLGHLLAGYWDAPIFHPTPGAFALSEAQPLTGLVAAPLAAVTGNATLAYNLVVLLMVVLNGLGGARLARRLGAGPVPAMLTGLMAQGLPFVADELGVLQLVAVFPLFFLADAVLAWAEDGRRRDGVAAGAWFAATFLTCGYYGLFAGVVVPLAALALLSRRLLTRDRVVGLAVGAVVFAVTTLPFLLTQKQVTDGYRRSDRLLEQQSADAGNWLHLDVDRPGLSPMPSTRLGDPDVHALWPGTVVLLGAGYGAVLLARDAGRRRAGAFLGAGALAAFALSFGSHLGIGGVNLYALLRDHVPGFASLRSPFRFGALTQVFLVGLAAPAIDREWRRGPSGLRAVVVGVVALSLVETALPTGRVVDVPSSDAAWIGYLRDHHRDTADAVAMVPFPASGDVEDYEPTARWMLQGLDHGHPLVNGYSGLFPADYERLEAAMQTFPDADGLAALRARGVGWVVVDRRALAPDRRAELDRAHTAYGLLLRVDDPAEAMTVYELAT